MKVLSVKIRSSKCSFIKMSEKNRNKMTNSMIAKESHLFELEEEVVSRRWLDEARNADRIELDAKLELVGLV